MDKNELLFSKIGMVQELIKVRGFINRRLEKLYQEIREVEESINKDDNLSTNHEE